MTQESPKLITAPSIRLYRSTLGTVQIISGSFSVLAGIALMAVPMDNGAWTTTSHTSWLGIPIGMFVVSTGILGMYSKRRTSKYPLLAYAVLSAVTLILCVIGCYWTWSQIRILYHYLHIVDVRRHRRAWFRLLTTCILLVTTTLQAAMAECGAFLPYAYICCKEYHYEPSTQEPLRVVTTSENGEAVATFPSDGRSSISPSSIRLYSRRIYEDNNRMVTASDDYEEYNADSTEENDGTIQHVYAANKDVNEWKYYSLKNMRPENEGKTRQVYTNDLAFNEVEKYPQSSEGNEEQIQHVYAEDLQKDTAKYYYVAGSIAKGDSKVQHTYAEELIWDKRQKTYQSGGSQESEDKIEHTYAEDLEVREKIDYSYESCSQRLNDKIKHVYAEHAVKPKYYYIKETNKIEHTYYEDVHSKS